MKNGIHEIFVSCIRSILLYLGSILISLSINLLIKYRIYKNFCKIIKVNIRKMHTLIKITIILIKYMFNYVYYCLRGWKPEHDYCRHCHAPLFLHPVALPRLTASSSFSSSNPRGSIARPAKEGSRETPVRRCILF